MMPHHVRSDSKVLNPLDIAATAGARLQIRLTFTDKEHDAQTNPTGKKCLYKHYSVIRLVVC